VFRSKIRTLRAATQDNVHVLISTRFNDGGNTLLRDTHERMRVGTRAHRVNRDLHTSVCAVLKADWEGYARGEFAMELRLCGACANRTPRDEVIDVLRGNSVKKFRPNGNAKMGEVAKKLPGETESLVYLKRTIYGRVIDKTFPADRRARFLNEEGSKEYQGCVGRSDELNHLAKKTYNLVSRKRVAGEDRRTNKPA
jgi:hypothetical protein